MTPLRRRFIEDMQLRGLAPTTQRSYTHYAVGFAKYYDTSPEHLDLEAVRQCELHLLNERKLSPQTVNTFISAVQFLYTVTLDMPWGKECFPRVRVPEKLPVVLDQEEVADFFRAIPSLKYRAAHALLRRRSAHLRSRLRPARRYRFQTHADPRRTGQREEGSLHHAAASSAGHPAALLAIHHARHRVTPRSPRPPVPPRLAVSLLAASQAPDHGRVVARLPRRLHAMRPRQARHRSHPPSLCRFPDYAA